MLIFRRLRRILSGVMSTETRRLLRELQTAQKNLQDKEDLLKQLELNMDAKKAELDQLTL